jgi:DNA-binding XRE family transcriptional regulator
MRRRLISSDLDHQLSAVIEPLLTIHERVCQQKFDNQDTIVLKNGLLSKEDRRIMYAHTQDLRSAKTQNLRREAGRWLADLRREAGLSQRDLANAVGSEFYTFISQIENGKGRIPPDKYRLWAKALNVDVQEFVRTIVKYYDPITYAILFS